MLDNIDIVNVLFLDIETVSAHASFDDLSDNLKYLWKLKSRQILRKPAEELTEEEVRDLYPQRAAIYAEFGKIVCISVGIVVREVGQPLKLRVKSYADEDEKILLQGFSKLLDKHYTKLNSQYMCGHNIKEFDVPYMCRRLVINQLPLPKMLDIPGKKPWELKHFLDTMTLWKFGDYKAYTSLRLLTAVFNIPSPKDDIDGSEVGMVFWKQKDLERIAIYCEKDVLATTQLFLRYKCMDLLTEEQVQFIGR